MRDDEAIAQGPTGLATAPDQEDLTGDDRLQPGDLAGEYEIVEHLGAGAMGDVYAGTHPVVEKRVAVKVIKRKLAGSAEAVERFVREAKAVNRVDHPSVLDVFSFGRLDDGRLYLVMDLLSGESLGDRIRRDGAMSIADALAVLEPVCSALAAAHARDVVHRDLKPDNVFVTDAGEVYVLDFGIAKMLTDVAAEAGVQTLTGEGVWLGTPAYMAPEQWTADGASAASDIYALGAMCFEMLTGRVPYRARSVPAMMEQHFHADIPLLTTSAGVTMPAALDDVIRRAMAKVPEDRYASPDALFDALRAACDGDATSAGSSAHSIDGREPGRAALVTAGIAVVVVAAAAVALFALRTREETGSERTALPVRAKVASTKVSIDVRSTPDGARIYRANEYVGLTPQALFALDGSELELRLSKPGYADVVRSVVAIEGAVLDAALPTVAGFEGKWQLPDGSLRSFERRGERVVGYQHETVAGEPVFLRFFEFTPADSGSVSFGAAEEHVDERAPNEPSCRMDLRAEYRYTPATNTLELREQRIGYELTDGRCVVYAKEWKPYEAVTRLTERFEGPTRWATSTAGSSGDVETDSTTVSRAGDTPAGDAQAGDKPAPIPGRKAATNRPIEKKPPSNKADQAPGSKQPAQKSVDRPPASNQDKKQAPEPDVQQKKPTKKKG